MLKKSLNTISSPIQNVENDLLLEKEVQLFVKRDDLLHSKISGNKWRKLKFNLLEAERKDFHQLLTFGGAYSNHISATSAAGKEFGFSSVGIIRGEKIEPLNPTLAFAEACGMHLHFIDRTTFRNKQEPFFIEELENQFGTFYLLPEGGTNELAIKGCEEIISESKTQFETLPDYYCVPCGTGGTISGIISGLNGKAKVLGFSALKGDFLKKEVGGLLNNYGKGNLENWTINTDFHFGGYAKYKMELIDFINDFKQEHQIPLDPIYTGKMFYGIMEMVRNDFFEKGAKVLAIHTGGLQGIDGFNKRFGKMIF